MFKVENISILRLLIITFLVMLSQTELNGSLVYCSKFARISKRYIYYICLVYFGNTIANVLEMLHPCTKPVICKLAYTQGMCSAKPDSKTDEYPSYFCKCLYMIALLLWSPAMTRNSPKYQSSWGPPGSCRPQLGPILAPWTLLSGVVASKPNGCGLSSAQQTGEKLSSNLLSCTKSGN